MMNTKSLTFLALVSLIGAGSCTEQPKKDHERPNFIIIQMDDLGFSDLGIHGNKIVETPVIDSFARQSVQFQNFYVNPVCAPSRASLLTGRQFLKTGVSHVHGGKDFLNLSEHTFADVMKSAGYSTGMWGKWHSGMADEYYPWQRGFDEAYQAHLYTHRNSYGHFNGKEVKTNRWADDVITGYALDFIKRHRAKPFVAYLSFLTCHSPLDAPEELIRKYQDKGLSRNLSTLYAMIDHADVSLGRFFREIDSLGVTGNTVIMFLSDNGPAIENDKFTDEDRAIRYVNHLKGHKGNIWENGVKSAFFVSWKGHYKPKFVDGVTDITDILPTMMDIAGVSLPGGYLPPDGISFRSFLDGEGKRQQKTSYNYANPAWPPTDQPWTPEGVKDEYRPVTPEEKADMVTADQIISVRKGDFKLLLNPARYAGTPKDVNGYVLVNIKDDPTEDHNIIAQNEKVFEDLRNDLFNWFESIKKSDHSFAMPVFFIADTLSNEIPAKAPVRNSLSLKNTFNSLWGWNNPADWSEYNIDVLTPAKYAVILGFQGEMPVGSVFTTETGNRIEEAALDEAGNAGIIELNKTDRMLKISCKTSSDKIYKLMSITLKKI